MKQSVWGLLVLASCLQLTSSVREPEFADVKNSLKLAQGWYWDYATARWAPPAGPTCDLAHVYPYNAMEKVVRKALDKWPNPAKPDDRHNDHEAPARLLAFLDWLFRIDEDAVVNPGVHPGGFHPGRGQIDHSAYLNRNGAGLVARNEVLKNEAKRKIDIDPGQLWRFTTNNKLVNKRFAIWQFSREKWDWDDTHGWLKNKRRYYQLTLPQHDISQGAQISLTNWQSNWESWKKSRPITLEGDTNQWFTLYNVRSKRYLTAATQRSTQIRAIIQVDVAPDSQWFKELLQYCTSAPANLRYGEHWTNNLIDNWVDPMGDVNGNPTDKECEGARRPSAVFESFKRHSTNPAILFSSTGSITSTEPTYRKYPAYNFYAIRVTTSVARTCNGRYGEWGDYLARV